MNKQRTDRPTRAVQRQTAEQSKTDKQITHSQTGTQITKSQSNSENRTGRNIQQTRKEQLKGADLNTLGNKTFYAGFWEVRRD